MRVHHLNCGTMHMPGAELVCHVLLLETATGLALVDTGFGRQDIADPRRRIGPYRSVIRPVLDPEQTAARQIEARGWDTSDVRHIVITHFDLDHIGGLADFPDAQVHLTRDEAMGAIHEPSWRERIRYRPPQWEHGPHLVEHGVRGDRWREFGAAEQLAEIDDGVLLIALPGHTRGHAAVAVQTRNGWILHAGDAFYHPGTLGDGSRVPKALWIQEAAVGWKPRLVRQNHARLAEVYQRHDPDLQIVCAHDPSLLALMQARSIDGETP